MGYFRHHASCTCITEETSHATGGLSPWRECLVKQMILANLSECIEVSALADACALSRSHFSRAFKCSTGLSPQDWVRAQRLERAKDMIQNTDMTLTQISQECGFCDQAHFSHFFTRREGMNPMTWRSHVLRATDGQRPRATSGRSRQAVPAQRAAASL